MNDSLTSDISFFIYFHIVKSMLETDVLKESTSETDSETDSEESDDSPGQDLDAIRQEVEREALEENSHTILDEDEEEDDRVSRLKSLAKKQKMSSKNQLKVKRLSN